MDECDMKDTKIGSGEPILRLVRGSPNMPWVPWVILLILLIISRQ